MICNREEEIIKKLNEIRHLKKGLEEIEEFERLVRELAEYNNIDIIPELCSIMEDNASNCSVFEEVIELMLELILQAEDKKKGLENIFTGLSKMKEHGEEWAEILHAQILREHMWIEDYIDCAKQLRSDEKEELIHLLQILDEDEFVEEVDLKKIIEDIKK